MNGFYLPIFICLSVSYGLILPLAGHEATCQDWLMTSNAPFHLPPPFCGMCFCDTSYCHDALLPFGTLAAAFLLLCCVLPCVCLSPALTAGSQQTHSHALPFGVPPSHLSCDIWKQIPKDLSPTKIPAPMAGLCRIFTWIKTKYTVPSPQLHPLRALPLSWAPGSLVQTIHDPFLYTWVIWPHWLQL